MNFIEPAGPFDVYAASFFLGLGIAVSPWFLLGILIIWIAYVWLELT